MLRGTWPGELSPSLWKRVVVSMILGIKAVALNTGDFIICINKHCGYLLFNVSINEYSRGALNTYCLDMSARNPIFSEQLLLNKNLLQADPPALHTAVTSDMRVLGQNYSLRS